MDVVVIYGIDCRLGAAIVIFTVLLIRGLLSVH